MGVDDVTCAQILSQHGYFTQMIFDTPMLAIDNYDFTRGFQSLDFVHGQKGDPWVKNFSAPIQMPAQIHKMCEPERFETYLRNRYERKYEREFCVGETFSKAMDWLQTNYNHEPFFLWIDMWDPHEPFDCPWYDYELYADPTYKGDHILYPQYGRSTYMSDEEIEDLRAYYAGKCTLVDRWVRHFLDTAEKLGLFKNTLIIWTTDHGHLFGDHNLQGKPGSELGRLYEVTTRIPLLVHHPEGIGAGKRVEGIVQPPDILPSILESLDVPIPHEVQGCSFWPLVTGEKDKLHEVALSSRYPRIAGNPFFVPAEGAAFDGWRGSDRVVEPSTITTDQWTYLCAIEGMPSELYNIKEDPDQEKNVLEQHPEVARKLRKLWIEFLETHGAPSERIQPFREPGAEVHTPHSGELYAFRDDRGQWIAFPTKETAQTFAYRENAPGPRREIEKITFGELLEDNPRNLLFLCYQYYWAQDLE